MTAEHLNTDAKMSTFALTFPSLRNAPGVKLWDANTLDQWVADGSISHGERVTAQFVLHVWDPDHAWRSGKFELMEALRTWATQHHSAFLTWGTDPWWP